MRFSPQVCDIGLVANSPVPPPAASFEAATLAGQAPPSAKRWLCAQHRSGLGARARFSLRSAGFEVHWPREVERPSRGDDILRPLFPGYLFVQVGPGAQWGEAHRANYILGLVGVRENGKPAIVPTGFVEALIKRAGAIDMAIDDTPEAKMTAQPRHSQKCEAMKAGKVRIVDGAFEGLEGILRSDRGEDRVRVLLEILGAEREVTVSRQMVEQVL